jgi:hypothetical protein
MESGQGSAEGTVSEPTPIRADVMAALEHENFCRWPDHRDCCGVTVEDCTCNVDLNIRALERLGWMTFEAESK